MSKGLWTEVLSDAALGRRHFHPRESTEDRTSGSVPPLWRLLTAVSRSVPARRKRLNKFLTVNATGWRCGAESAAYAVIAAPLSPLPRVNQA